MFANPTLTNVHPDYLKHLSAVEAVRKAAEAERKSPAKDAA